MNLKVENKVEKCFSYENNLKSQDNDVIDKCEQKHIIMLLLNYIKNEFFEYYRFSVDKNHNLMRLDKFLMSFIENTTRNKIQNAIRKKNILVNGMSVKPNYKVYPLDLVSIVLPIINRVKLIPENIPLTIVYEDEDLLIINKSAGMVVHPGHGNDNGTLANSLVYHFNSLKKQMCELKDRPGLVHRIDKDTSGLLLIAKNEYTMNHLAKQFFDRTIERFYVALVWGDFQNNYGTIQGNIGRDLKDRMKMSVFTDGSQGKPAITHYRVLERFHYVTLLECKLETGRMHQIRAHMKHLDHPLFNDERYGGRHILNGTISKHKQFVENCFKILPRQALHAKTLKFIHPKTQKKMFFDSDLPEDMCRIIKKWKNYTKTN